MSSYLLRLRLSILTFKVCLTKKLYYTILGASVNIGFYR